MELAEAQKLVAVCREQDADFEAAQEVIRLHQAKLFTEKRAAEQAASRKALESCLTTRVQALTTAYNALTSLTGEQQGRAKIEAIIYDLEQALDRQRKDLRRMQV